ncbi:PIN-like domain-containing protein [Aliarcobacter butzleri]|uniref:PIN-like domain-containing protein n=1 Tax=Aliarcobacter butzleri TaxID=28197 RepID=UPI00263BF365|nr:PIN-like domain-containing protein [Aliarcobacter butzleri]MDN5049535.1 PIN-like domain-containing protein [Aliarcobacter butzleri]MDN5056662.1 PIN-like domain-containing protein [Aliarcobacter butzleri]
MKNSFKAYYLADTNEIMNRTDTIFVFDTNVLLNLYSYTEQTREDFFSLLDIVKDRVWIPYHVGLEYQRNRLSVIRTEKKIFNDLIAYISNIKKNLDTNSLQSLKLKQRLPKINEETIKLQKKIIEELDKYSELVKEWDNKQPCVRSEDLIRERIDKIFDNKIGEIPKNQEYLNELFKSGKERYENKIPPGYEDEKTKKDYSSFKYNNLEYIPMYGDYIIWEQLINEVKNKDLKSLLFITDDVKEDWLYLIDSNGKKEIGPRVELVDEILEKTNIELFHIMKSSDFLINGKEFFNSKIKDDSIEELNESFDANQNNYLTHLLFENGSIEKPKTTTEKFVEMMTKMEIEKPKTVYEKWLETMTKMEIEKPKTVYEKWLETMTKMEIEKPKTVYEELLESMTKMEIEKPKVVSERLAEMIKSKKNE